MAKIISDMTVEELLGDPDSGHELRGPVRQRLLEQSRWVEQGERGRPLGEVMAELELD